jgi:hypothetical protein
MESNKELKCEDCNLEVKKEHYIEKHNCCISCYKNELRQKMTKCKLKMDNLLIKSKEYVEESNYNAQKYNHCLIKFNELNK